MARASKKVAPPVESDVFSSAPVVIVGKKPPGKRELAEKTIQGVLKLASVNATIKVLQAVAARLREDIEVLVHAEFIREGRENKRRPNNFYGIEGIGSALVSLTKSTARLSEEALALLREHKIPIDVTTKAPETFIINPAYASDIEFVKLLGERLGPEIKNLEDHRGPLIQKQSPVLDLSIHEDALDMIFHKDEATLRLLLPIVFGLSIGTKIEGNDIRPVLPFIHELLESDAWTDVIKEAMTGKSKGRRAA